MSIAVAAPLLAAAVGCAWLALIQRNPPLRPPLTVVEHCRRAAELLYDVS